MPAELLTVREAAQYLRVSESWLRHPSGNRPRKVRLGRNIVYRLDALRDFVTAHEEEETHGQAQCNTVGARAMEG